jgi:hypothetical protein
MDTITLFGGVVHALNKSFARRKRPALQVQIFHLPSPCKRFHGSCVAAACTWLSGAKFTRDETTCAGEDGS